jgi:DNA polymerase-3 subunit alpha
VIVYQEQVMQIAVSLASYTMAEADGLRKAMGKKIAAMMAKERERFVKGAVANGIAEEKAKALFDLMEKFGGYGFNKSHSAAYALIAFQTAYLKAHYPVEFIAALLTSEMNSIDGVVKYVNECRSHHIELLPPDINSGEKEFTVVGDKIRFGLVAVKNVGEGAIEAIIEERQAKGVFKSLFEFSERVDLRKVNKRVVESLISCGAFDSTSAPRSQMMAILEEALEYGQKVQHERCDPQMGLFGDNTDCTLSVTPPAMPKLTEWEIKERLNREKESLGFYISGHPLDDHRKTLAKFANMDTTSIQEAEDGRLVRIGGIVAGRKVLRTKKEELMAFINLEDLAGTLEVVTFPSLYGTCAELLGDDRPILIEGKVQREEKGTKLIAETIIPMEQAEALWTAAVHFHVDSVRFDSATLSRLRDLIRRFPGDCKVYLHLRFPEGTETVIAVEEGMRVQPGEELTRAVNGSMGGVVVETQCSEIKTAANGHGSRRNGGKYPARNGAKRT